MVYPKLVQGVIFYRENERLLLDKNGWQKKAFSLSVNVFSTKVLTGDTILRLLLETEPPFNVVIRVTRGSSHLQGKGNTFIFQLY